MHFTETRQRLSGEREERPATALEQGADRLVLRHDAALAEAPATLALAAGSLCLAYFWLQHPYNARHWLARDGATLGFALNLSGPTFIGDDVVEWSDLAVRVLLAPDATLGYRVEVEGEDDLPDVDDATYRHIQFALGEVLAGWPELVRFLSQHSARLIRE